MNKIILKGRITRDPEVKTTQTGTPYCRFSIAVNRSYKREGEPEADFFNCVVWQKTAEFVGKYFRKGQEMLLTGEMQSSAYTTREGAKATAWEVQVREVEFSGSKSDNPSPATPYTAGSAPAYSAPPASPNFQQIGTDEDLPF